MTNLIELIFSFKFEKRVKNISYRPMLSLKKQKKELLQFRLFESSYFLSECNNTYQFRHYDEPKYPKFTCSITIILGKKYSEKQHFGD